MEESKFAFVLGPNSMVILLSSRKELEELENLELFTLFSMESRMLGELTT
jgi:hypothetical protein